MTGVQTCALPIYDSGRILDTDTDYIDFILPNSKVAVEGFEYDLTASVASIDFRASWDTQDMGGETPGAWVIQNVAVDVGRYSTKVTGDIQSTFSEVKESVEIVAVLYDEADNIVGGGFTYIDRVYNDKFAVFEISVRDEVKFNRAEV